MAEKKRKGEADVYPLFHKKAKPGSEDTSTQTGLKDFNAEASLLEFQKLLDFSLVDNEEEIARRFDLIPRMLLHGFRLVVKPENKPEVEFEIMEAEFYLQVDSCHEDPFTHGSEEQKISGRWYFHRAPKFSKDSHRSLTSSTEYRGGSRKGMDLTLGGPPLISLGAEGGSTSGKTQGTERLLRGGILLRTLRQVSNQKVTSGPSLLVDRVIAASGASSIGDLVEAKWGGNISAFFSEANSPATCLYLKPVAPVSNPATIYLSPRIGLDLSHPGTTGVATLPLHPRIRFLPNRYRFFVHPELLVANGRPQTFLGVLHSCISSYPTHSAGLQKPSLSREICRLTGLKEPTSAKYLAEYLAGRNGGAELLQSFIGSKGKGASSSPATYLRMMGALSNLNT